MQFFTWKWFFYIKSLHKTGKKRLKVSIWSKLTYFEMLWSIKRCFSWFRRAKTAQESRLSIFAKTNVNISKGEAKRCICAFLLTFRVDSKYHGNFNTWSECRWRCTGTISVMKNSIFVFLCSHLTWFQSTM